MQTGTKMIFYLHLDNKITVGDPKQNPDCSKMKKMFEKFMKDDRNLK